MKINIPLVLRQFGTVFQENGKEAFLAGGAVRDAARLKETHDYDVATNAKPDEVIRMFKRVIPTGIKHGTVTVLYKGHSIEVTTYRSEADYHDGRHPEYIEFAATIRQDLSRRDFTMNAIAASITQGGGFVLGEIVDPFNGMNDIKNKIIRCVGRVRERFAEDGLRPLRALRFASTLGFALDKELLEAIPQSLEVCKKVSSERVRMEFEKIIMSNSPSIALKEMNNTGLLELFLPELARCGGVEQRGFHAFDVLTHQLLACDYAAKKNYTMQVRTAALLHDIGKPRCAAFDSARGVWTFYEHEKYGAETAARLLERLRFPSSFIKEVVHLIREHMFHYEDCWGSGAVRRFIVRAGRENLRSLFDLRYADSFAMRGIEPDPALLLSFQNRIEDVLAKSSVLGIKDLDINGRDLMAAGFAAGPRLGIILKELLACVLEDPELNEKEKLLEIARKTG